jgi:hypothetical protein
MAYTPTTPELGIQPIAAIPATGTVNHPLGTVVDAYDPTYGAGKSNVVGAVVAYNQLTGITTLVPNTANLGAPLAVSMTANTSTTTGSWFQIEGATVIKKTAVKVSPAVKLYISGTAGRLMPTAASGKQVLNVISINAATVLSATSTITAQLAYPFAQGATA